MYFCFLVHEVILFQYIALRPGVCIYIFLAGIQSMLAQCTLYWPVSITVTGMQQFAECMLFMPVSIRVK